MTTARPQDRASSALVLPACCRSECQKSRDGDDSVEEVPDADVFIGAVLMVIEVHQRNHYRGEAELLDEGADGNRTP